MEKLKKSYDDRFHIEWTFTGVWHEVISYIDINLYFWRSGNEDGKFRELICSISFRGKPSRRIIVRVLISFNLSEPRRKNEIAFSPPKKMAVKNRTVLLYAYFALLCFFIKRKSTLRNNLLIQSHSGNGGEKIVHRYSEGVDVIVLHKKLL